jgi:hypothetical protein
MVQVGAVTEDVIVVSGGLVLPACGSAQHVLKGTTEK